MSWRDVAKDAQAHGHDRHDRHESPSDGPIVPIVPNVPAAPPLDDARAGIRLREWHAKLSKVDEFTSPPGWTLNQWLALLDAACWFYEGFGRQAALQGFGTLDLFGAMPAGPGTGGIVDRIGNARNLKLADGRAHWSFMGAKGWLCRGGALDLPGIVPLWELNR